MQNIPQFLAGKSLTSPGPHALAQINRIVRTAYNRHGRHPRVRKAVELALGKRS